MAPGADVVRQPLHEPAPPLARFYLDECLSPQVAVIARTLGLDVISLQESGHKRSTDEEVLRLAALDGRCVVTRNRDHFYAETVRFFGQGWPHKGVLIVPRSLPNNAFARIAGALAVYAASQPGGTPDYTLDYLSANR